MGNRTRHAAALLAALTTLAACGAAAAQGPPPDGMGGPPPMGQFGGRMGRHGGPPPASAATVPAETLASELSLTAAQTAKVKGIQEAFQQQRRGLMPAPGDGSGPPDPSTMDALRTKMQALDKQTSADVLAVLTPAQKAALPALLSEVDTLRHVGIPAELMSSLKLTDAQKAQLTSIAKDAQTQGPQGHRAAFEKAQAVLTDAQKAQLDAFRQAHPRPQFGRGGPGGDGPPPPGDGSGPPPPGE